MQKIFIYSFSLSLLCFSGCKEAPKTDPQKYRDSINVQAHTGSEFARGFSIEQTKGGAWLLHVFDPWDQGSDFLTYHIDNESEVNLPGVALPQNPQRIAVSSTTHIAFLSATGALPQVIGSTNPERVCDSMVNLRYQVGDFLNLGRDMDYNLEALINAEPDLIIQTGFEGQLSKDARLLELGIPVVYIHEWMEPTPLGRAEWIKVIGLVSGKLSTADSIFRSIRNRYIELTELANKAGKKVKVMSGNDFKGTWYMPGGENFMSQFFRDAHLQYHWSDEPGSASLTLGIETVLEEFANADLWIGITAGSKSELLGMDPRYIKFNPAQTGQVFNVNRRVNAYGGNDIWERGVIHPEEILQDLILMGHPGLLENVSLIYYQKISGYEE